MGTPRFRARGERPGRGARQDDCCSGRVGGFSDQFILKTIRVWQPRSQLRLSKEDARQIIENAVGFFSVLADWDDEAEDERSPAQEGR